MLCKQHIIVKGEEYEEYEETEEGILGREYYAHFKLYHVLN